MVILGQIQKWVYAWVLFAVICSCGDKEPAAMDPPKMNDPEVEVPQAIKYLALGDSYTIGQGVTAPERWPNQLVDELEQNDYEVPLLKIIAQTGWTTSSLINAIESEELEDFDLVSLLIGVNNQYQSKPFERFEMEFGVLLDKAISIAGSLERVFVVSIPDYGVTPFGANNSQQIAEELDEYNAHMAEVCLAQNIPFIDITEISRLLGDGEGALSDNLHPSGMQYGQWVDKMLPVVLDILEE